MSSFAFMQTNMPSWYELQPWDQMRLHMLLAYFYIYINYYSCIVDLVGKLMIIEILDLYLLFKLY